MFESLPVGFFLMLIFLGVIEMDLLYNEKNVNLLVMPLASSIIKIMKEFFIIF